MSELKDLLPVALHRAAGAAAGQLQQRVNGSAQRLAELQQLLQVNEAALSAEASTHQTTRTSLAELQKRLAEYDAELYSSKSKYNQLKVDLEGSNKKCQGLQRQLQVKEKELAALNVELDSTQADLEDAKCRGQELLTFQGMGSAEADLGTLNQALKQLSDATADLVTVLLPNAQPMVPFIVDLRSIKMQAESKMRQLKLHGLTHAVLAEAARHVFGTFRAHHLIIDISSSPYDQPADEHAVLLQLMLEKKKALGWLQLVNADSSSMQGQYFGAQVVEKAAKSMATGLLHSKLLQWSDEIGASLPAAAGVLPTGIAAAAVYCLEPAVIHVAERMGQLVTQVPDARMQPFRVIRKAKVCVAQPAK
ncbi:hypothetical protein COO60DRAFT_1686261 [Scenedesmus sp. NREL 46B-D3]|nr:hypothetical protein COO60DRAFT_1686261 [Scenedesmus sp. NREL 46B-D3]